MLNFTLQSSLDALPQSGIGLYTFPTRSKAEPIDLVHWHTFPDSIPTFILTLISFPDNNYQNQPSEGDDKPD